MGMPRPIAPPTPSETAEIVKPLTFTRTPNKRSLAKKAWWAKKKAEALQAKPKDRA